MTAPPPPPGEVRDAAHEILGRAEFQHHESLVQRVLDWIGDQLSRFSFGVGHGPGFLGDLVGLLVVAAALTALVLLLRAWRWPARRRRAEDDLIVEIEHLRTEAEWRSEAEQLEADGKWREALRARYRELVRFLVDRGVLPDVPGRTTGEHRVDIDASLPGAAEDFDAVTRLFEDVWYGGGDTGPDGNRLVRARADAVRAAVEAHAEDGRRTGSEELVAP